MDTTSHDIVSEIRSLAPWHLDVEVEPGVRTGTVTPAEADNGGVSIINPDEIRPLLMAIYPEGLAGRGFLDVACNGGGYSLLAAELGAAFVFGFDIREHWIRQAEFLKSHWGWTDEQVRFEVCDLADLGERAGAETFHICLFKGIFYHLPDPVAGLRQAAELTSEILILDTAAAHDRPDGFLELQFESTEHPMSGVHALAWLPTGPTVLENILRWLGFAETRLIRWRRDADHATDRIRVIGARSKACLEHFDRTWEA